MRVLTSWSSSYEIEGEIWIKSEGADAAPGPDEGEAANPAEEGGARRDHEGEDTQPVNSTSELPGIVGTSVDTFEDGVKSSVKPPGEVVVLDNATSEDARLALPGSMAAGFTGDPGSSTLPWATRMAARAAGDLGIMLFSGPMDEPSANGVHMGDAGNVDFRNGAINVAQTAV